MTAIQFVLPFRLFVADGTSPVAEGDTAIHTARSLCTTVAAVQCLFNFSKVADTLVNGTITGLFSMNGQECFWISHCFFELS